MSENTMKHDVICPNCKQGSLTAVLRKDSGQPFSEYKTMLVCETPSRVRSALGCPYPGDSIAN